MRRQFLSLVATPFEPWQPRREWVNSTLTGFFPRIVFRDLERWPDGRLDGMRMLEIKVQEPSTGCDQIILIRYEE